MITQELLVRARTSRVDMAMADTETKNRALLAMADALEKNAPAILEANALDLRAAEGRVSHVMLDRLALSGARIAGMAQGVREVAAHRVGEGAGRSGPTGWSSKRPPSPWGSSPSSTRAAPTSPPTRRHWR